MNEIYYICHYAFLSFWGFIYCSRLPLVTEIKIIIYVITLSVSEWGIFRAYIIYVIMQKEIGNIRSLRIYGHMSLWFLISFFQSWISLLISGASLWFRNDIYNIWNYDITQFDIFYMLRWDLSIGGVILLPIRSIHWSYSLPDDSLCSSEIPTSSYSKTHKGRNPDLPIVPPPPTTFDQILVFYKSVSHDQIKQVIPSASNTIGENQSGGIKWDECQIEPIDL